MLLALSVDETVEDVHGVDVKGGGQDMEEHHRQPLEEHGGKERQPAPAAE